MPTPFESAQLNLQLFELRREPVLRAARSWFLWDFNPKSLAELAALVRGERNAAFRMVLGYWDMGASLVTTGAIASESFLAAHGKIVAAYSKVWPFLAELRTLTKEPDFCRHIEAVVMSMSNATETLARRRSTLLAAAAARAAVVPPPSE